MVFGRKIKASFDVSFDEGRSLDGMPAFQPGETVSGQSRFMPEDDVTVDKFEVQLVWYTEGRGDQDLNVISSVEGGVGLLTAGIPIETRFSFKLPDYPWSYKGELLNIIWGVRVLVDPAKGRTFHESVPFVVSPTKATLHPPAEPL